MKGVAEGRGRRVAAGVGAGVGVAWGTGLGVGLQAAGSESGPWSPSGPILSRASAPGEPQAVMANSARIHGATRQNGRFICLTFP